MKRKLLPFILAALFVMSIALALFPSRSVFAAFDPAQNQHLDRSLILFDGHEYFDGQIDDTYSYGRTDDTDGCPDVIDSLTNHNAQATLHTKTKDPVNGGCTDSKSNISLAHPERADMPFIYTDTNHIKTSDGKSSYTYNDSVKVFLEDGGDHCKDTLKVTAGGPTADGATVAVTASTAGQNTAYDSWAQGLTFHADSPKDGGNGCTNYGPQSYQVSTVFISDPKLGNPAASGGSSGLTGSGGGSTTQCEATGVSLAWLICPVLNGITAVSDSIITNVVTPLLQTGSIDTTAGSTIFNIWSNFRVLANILLVILFVVIIGGQAIGGGIVDAYTAKKALPRILIAAVLINLSIYIVALMVDVTNVLGGGIANLITSPLGSTGHLSYQIHLGGQVGFFAILAALFVAVKAIGVGTVIQFLGLFVFLPVLFAILGVMVTVILRRGIILALIMVAPVAFALFCLPATEKYFRQWWKLLFEALLVYPIIIAVFAVSQVLAATLNISSQSGGFVDFIGVFAAIIVSVLPLALVPFAFKLAGGLISNLHGTFTGFAKKSHQSILGNANDPNSLRNTARRQVTGNIVKSRAQFVRSNSNRRGVRGFIGRGANFGNVLDKEAEINEDAQRRMGRTSGAGDDKYIRARTSLALYQTKGADGVIGETTDISQAQRDAQGRAIRVLDGTGNAMRASLNGQKRFTDNDYNKATHLYQTMGEVQEAVNYEAKKTLTDADTDRFLNGYGAFAEQEGFTEEQATGLFTGVAFSRQNERLEMKHGKITRGDDGKLRVTRATDNLGTSIGSDGQVRSLGGRDAFIQELYDKKGSYLVGQMHDSTINEVSDAKDSYAKEIRDLASREGAGTLTPPEKARLELSRRQLEEIQQMENTWVGEERRIPAQPGQLIPAGDGQGEGTPAQSYPGLSGAAEGVQQAAKRLAFRDVVREDGTQVRVRKRYDKNGQLEGPTGPPNEVYGPPDPTRPTSR